MDRRDIHVVGAPCVFSDSGSIYPDDKAANKCGSGLRCVEDKAASRIAVPPYGSPSCMAVDAGLCVPRQACERHEDCGTGPYYCNTHAVCQRRITCFQLNDAVDCSCPELLGDERSQDILGLCAEGDAAAVLHYSDMGWGRMQCPGGLFKTTCETLQPSEPNSKCGGTLALGVCKFQSVLAEPFYIASLIILSAAVLVQMFVVIIARARHNLNTSTLYERLICRCLSRRQAFAMLPVYQKTFVFFIWMQMGMFAFFVLSLEPGDDGGGVDIDASGFFQSSNTITQLMWCIARLMHFNVSIFSRPTLSRDNLKKALRMWAVLQVCAEAFLGSPLVLLLSLGNSGYVQALCVPMFWLVWFVHRWAVEGVIGFGRRKAGKILALGMLVLEAILLLSTWVVTYTPSVYDYPGGPDQSGWLGSMTIRSVIMLIILAMWCLALPVLLVVVYKIDTDYWKGAFQLDSKQMPNFYRSDPKYQELRRTHEGKVPLILVEDGAVDSLAGSEALAAQTVIDYAHLELGSKLGDGSFAAVFKGVYRRRRGGVKGVFSSLLIQGDLSITVAVKVLQNSDVSEETIASYVNECTLASLFDHENIIKCYGVCIAPPDLSIVQEFCERGSLADLLPEVQVMPWARKLGLMLQLAEGLAYMHDEKSCVHRDIKPDNVLVTADFTLKLTDFGVSTAVDEQMLPGITKKKKRQRRANRQERRANRQERRANRQEAAPKEGEYLHQSIGEKKRDKEQVNSRGQTQGLGSPIFMAPEIIKRYDEDDKHQADVQQIVPFAVDVFALAVTFWQLNSARMPYADIDSVFDIFEEVGNGRRPRVLGSDFQGDVTLEAQQEWTALLERMWDCEPEARPTAREVADELRRQQVSVDTA
jgi:serine/threonine protein kinase